MRTEKARLFTFSGIRVTDNREMLIACLDRGGIVSLWLSFGGDDSVSGSFRGKFVELATETV